MDEIIKPEKIDFPIEKVLIITMIKKVKSNGSWYGKKNRKGSGKR